MPGCLFKDTTIEERKKIVEKCSVFYLVQYKYRMQKYAGCKSGQLPGY